MGVSAVRQRRSKRGGQVLQDELQANGRYHPASRSAAAWARLTGATIPLISVADPVPRDQRTATIASPATHHER